MHPPKPSHFQFPLEIHAEGADWVARTSPSNYRVRAAIAGVLLPPLFWLLLFLLYVTQIDHASDATTFGFLATGGGLTVVSLLGGAILFFGAEAFSRPSRIRFDRTRRVVRRERDGFEVPWQAVALVRARAKTTVSGMALFTAIELVGQDRQVMLAIHERLASSHKEDIEGVVHFVTNLLGEGDYRTGHAVASEVGVTAPPNLFGATDTGAGSLCYIPVYGIGIFASAYYLLTAKSPFVRFCAIQSLVATGTMLGAIVVGASAMGVFMVVFHQDDGVFIVGIATLLVGIAVANLTAMILAAVRARRGRVWVFPWLRSILKRWIPA